MLSGIFLHGSVLTKTKRNMLEYYHGSDQDGINSIIKDGADISKGGGELGMGFYVGSSMWRACSWARRKAHNGKNGYNVLVYEFEEESLRGSLKIVEWGKRKTRQKYEELKAEKKTQIWTSNHDAIWAPIVGGGIRNVMQIKFESSKGQTFINKQNHKLLW